MESAEFVNEVNLLVAELGGFKVPEGNGGHQVDSVDISGMVELLIAPVSKEVEALRRDRPPFIAPSGSVPEITVRRKSLRPDAETIALAHRLGVYPEFSWGGLINLGLESLKKGYLFVNERVLRARVLIEAYLPGKSPSSP